MNRIDIARSRRTVKQVEFSYDGSRLFYTARGGEVGFVDLATLQSTLIRAPSPGLNECEIVAIGDGLLFCSDDSLFQIDMFTKVRTQLNVTGRATQGHVRPARFCAAIADCLRHEARVIDLHSMTELVTIADIPPQRSQSDYRQLGNATLSPDGELLVTWHSPARNHARTPEAKRKEHYLIAWRVRDGSRYREFRHINKQVGDVCVAPDNGLLVASSPYMLWCWDLEAADLRWRSRGALTTYGAVLFTVDGRCVMAVKNKNSVQVVDAADGSEVMYCELSSPRIVSLAVSPDGTRAAAGGSAGRVFLWDLTLPP